MATEYESALFSLDGGSAGKIIFPEFAQVSLLVGYRLKVIFLRADVISTSSGLSPNDEYTDTKDTIKFSGITAYVVKCHESSI